MWPNPQFPSDLVTFTVQWTSGFLPGDSYITQLHSIIHEMQTTFDKKTNVDIRGVFLDISKVFDKVW